ncbi:MAG: NADH-quinone oxidoreductase subunit L, partial [Legionella sp.]|nr:NADH-quinone oxidoreductase subunit L [Legionella sp.]
MNLLTTSWLCVLAPLLGAIIAGFFGKQVGRRGAHIVTIAGLLVAFGAALYVAKLVLSGGMTLNINAYTWASAPKPFAYAFHIGLLIDPLTAIMMVTVTFVSLLVHLYSVGYMADDAGYQRFFSYISLFTFMMLMLVTANGFLHLFFGWEGVGLVSYLLIGFWFEREAALQGSLKAFLVNRVGDFGFLLGIALLLMYTGSLDYATVFSKASSMSTQTIHIWGDTAWPVLTVISLLLFVGAMGKSAQVPLHVWLPESMEGPTPISALIHAATMVTAGVFMVARISPLIEYSETALSFVLVIGATGALFTGLLAIVMNDIKRVIAYSTLSQLGYMMVAMGASAFSAGMFHLLTHACFKALLFLAAGSVIMGMHHEQDMRKMGGLWKKMPITYVTFLIGGLALCAVPPFAGFYSKDTIIEAAKLSAIPGSSYAYVCVALGAMVTAIYTFRAFFMTFHGAPRMTQKTYGHVHESPWVVWLALVLLAIPSVILGYLLYQPILFDKPGLLGPSITVFPQFDVLGAITEEGVLSPLKTALNAPHSPVFWLTMSGIILAWLFYMVWPAIPARLARLFSAPYRVLEEKYGFDIFNDWVFVKGGTGLGRLFYRAG